MKNIFIPFLLLIGLMIQACEGPIGREGPMGPQGPPGVTVEADVFEIEGTFAAQTDWRVEVIFGDFVQADIGEDKILVYHLWEEGNIDIWRMLPQTIFMEQGIFQYNYDFTFEDLIIFLEGNFDLNTLEPIWTNNQIFRVVVIPTRLLNQRMDYSNYEEVIKYYNLDDTDIPRITVK